MGTVLVPLDGSAYAEEALAARPTWPAPAGPSCACCGWWSSPVHPFGLGQLAVGCDPTPDITGPKSTSARPPPGCGPGGWR